MKTSNVIKKALAILISAVMLLSVLPLSVFAEEPYTFEFQEVGDEVTVVYCNAGTATDIVVPEVYNGKPVTVIGDGAFSNIGYAGSEGEHISRQITLPKTIKKIGFLSFGLSPVVVTNLNQLSNLEYIGAYAFLGSHISGNIVLPESVEYVGASAFTATEITSLHLGKKVNIPQPEQSKKAMGNSLRGQLPSTWLSAISMETKSSEKSIALCCPELTKVTVDIRNPYYCSVNGVLYSKDMTKLYTYPSGKTGSVYVMPVTVDAFYNAFGGFYFYPIRAFGVTVDIFDGNAVKSDFLESMKFTVNLKTVVISDRVSEIVDIAFYNTGIESVFIPKSVTTIGKKAFWHCTELTTVGFDRNSSFKTLPSECFNDCTNLKNVTFGRIDYLEDLAFGNCSSLERIDLTNVMAIESTAFDGCTNLTDIVYQNTDSEDRATVSAQAFDHMASLETVMLGSSVEKVEAKAFANCANLQAAYISDEIEDISDTAFDGCDNLTIVCPTEECYAYSYATANNIPVTTLQVMPIPNQTYTGESIEPELTVKSSGEVLNPGSDYNTYFKDNIDAGLATATVMGEGKYSMFASVCKFAIVQRDLNDGVEISEIAPQVLNGEKAEPEITLTYNGKTLEKDVDYVVEYMDNTEAGTATVAVMGKNNFVGVYTAEFEITEAVPKYTGDANNDGVIDPSDYAMVVSYVMGQGKLTEEQKEFADINKDGVVDAFDAIAIDLIINKVILPE
ncbi:MAG: leucine-rich repeat protein [Oscillospiraceae bacterium]|nr:leucine-rich repeat protein [Oscillospiraceae bacterium]